MSDYFTYGQFVSCTNLVEFQQTKTFNVQWYTPPTEAYQYDRFELYRYIGPFMGCVDPSTINEGSQYSRLVFSAKQNYDSSGDPESYTIQNFFPFTSPLSTIEGSLTGAYVFTDDSFNTASPAAGNLRTFHGLPGISNNGIIINDIAYTRRVVYYILKTYIKGVQDAAPYLLTSHYNTAIFANHSTKSQVRHDYLHYEGDEIWAYRETGAVAESNCDNYCGMSRTAVDINRLYLDVSQTGATGRGGHAWVSDRSTGKVFQHNLRDGALIHTFNIGVKGRGHGIGIDLNTGDCIATPGDTSRGTNVAAWRCNQTTRQVTKIADLPNRLHGYGVLPLYGYPDKMIVTDYSNRGNVVLLNINTNQVTNGEVLNGYGGGSAPNGKALQAGLNNHKVSFISPINASHFDFNYDGAYSGLNSQITKRTSSRVTADSHNKYPATIVNSDRTNRDYFTVHSGNEFGMFTPASATQASQCTVLWAAETPWFERTTGYDGENNLWTPRKFKLYRTAGDHDLTDNIDDSYTYPMGGMSRYPSTKLQDWPLSFTNTREIEWFLTRNHGVSTLDVQVSTTEVREIDPSTLDKTVEVNWHPDKPSQTAYDAWWAMVDEKMLRKKGGNYYSSQYFNVFNPNNNNIDSNGKKWGIRIKVSDWFPEVAVLYNNNYDRYYEFGRSHWIPRATDLIKKWSEAFTGDDSYPGVPGRLSIINKNRQGILVHPFYQYAANHASKKFVNTNTSLLDSKKQELLSTYLDNIKAKQFSNLIPGTIYMYSDFTGSLLAGTIESSPLNRDIINPSPTLPTLQLLISGFQNNPGYQDVPLSCYPWQNTIPMPLTSMVAGITGYDDFNMDFLLNTNMGSYLITTYNLFTDDYFPCYLTDTNNLSVVRLNTNLSYNDAGNYVASPILEYTYHSPSVNGIYYLPSGNPQVMEHLQNAYDRPTGQFDPWASMNVVELYNFQSGGCKNTTISAQGAVKVLERWPEPKLYIDARDDRYLRQNFYCYNTWGRACLSTYDITEVFALPCPGGGDGNITVTTTVTYEDGIFVSATPGITSYNCDYIAIFEQTNDSILNAFTPQPGNAKVIVASGNTSNLQATTAVDNSDLQIQTAADNKTFVWLPLTNEVAPPSDGFSNIMKTSFTNNIIGLQTLGTYRLGDVDWSVFENKIHLPGVFPVKNFAPKYAANAQVYWYDEITQTFTSNTVTLSDYIPGGVPVSITRQLSGFEYAGVSMGTSPSRCVVMSNLVNSPYSVWFGGRHTNTATFIKSNIINSTQSPTSTGVNILPFGSDASVHYQLYIKQGNESIIASYPHLSGAYDNYAEHYFYDGADQRCGIRAIAMDEFNNVWVNSQIDSRLIKIPSSIYSLYNSICATGDVGYPLSSIPGTVILSSTLSAYPYSYYGMEIDHNDIIYAFPSQWATFANPNRAPSEFHIINTNTNKRMLLNINPGNGFDSRVSDIPAIISTIAGPAITSDASQIPLGVSNHQDIVVNINNVNYLSAAWIDANCVPYGISKGYYNNEEYIIISSYTAGARARTGYTILMNSDLINTFMDTITNNQIVPLSSLQQYNHRTCKFLVHDLRDKYNMLLNSIDPLDYRQGIGTPRQSILIDGKIYGSGETGHAYAYKNNMDYILNANSFAITTNINVSCLPLSADKLTSTYRPATLKTGIAAVKDSDKNISLIILNQQSDHIDYIDVNSLSGSVTRHPGYLTQINYNYTNFTGFSESFAQQDNGVFAFRISAASIMPVKWKEIAITLTPTHQEISIPTTNMPMSAQLLLAPNTVLSTANPITTEVILSASFTPIITANYIDLILNMYRDTLNPNALTPPESLKIERIKVKHEL